MNRGTMNDEEILTILAGMTFKDNLAYLNCGDLDRTEYLKIDKVLKTLKGKWVGGKTQAHKFPYNPEPVIKAVVKSGQLPTNSLDYFYTPDSVINEMFEFIERIPEDSRVLEPSAGTGHIARRLLERWPSINLDMVELDPLNLSMLDGIRGNIISGNFLEFNPAYEYDLIVMNPPFNGDSGDYIDHINHAFEFLRNGGQLVSVVPGDYKNWQKNKRARVFFEKLCDNDVMWFELEGGEFADTNIKCSIISLHKSKEIWRRNEYYNFPSWYVWIASIWALNDKKAWDRWENAVKRLEKLGHIVDNSVTEQGIKAIDYLFAQVEDEANASGEGLYLNNDDRVALVNWVIDQFNEG